GTVVIEAKDLKKGFGDRVLIDGLSFSLPRNGIVGVIGPNGVGKTTTIGKLAKRLQGEGKQVMLAAGDTFRAAAVEQL
ncbi:ATP-binding cassette domain-containing protein, partial [Pseudoalteromonas sp. SIMBA_148]